MEMKPLYPLSKVLCKPKDVPSENEISGLVCQIPCRDCDSVYIGETKRSLETRKREHVNSVKNFEIKFRLCVNMLSKSLISLTGVMLKS